MAQGLRPHHHEWYIHHAKKGYDKDKHCNFRDYMYRCMICGKIYHERYEYKPPPKAHKGNKSLERNKKKYSSE